MNENQTMFILIEPILGICPAAICTNRVVFNIFVYYIITLTYNL